MALSVCLNCDMGEIQGSWDSGRDQKLLSYIDAVNVSCGKHAGNQRLIEETIKHALNLGVKIGAHPSYPDRKNFGREVMRIAVIELEESIKEQILFIKRLVEKFGGKLHHVKPHGALYNEAAVNLEVAVSIADVVKRIDESLVLFGLAQSKGVTKYKEKGLRVWEEVFVDRAYESDGSLRKRSLVGALIENPEKALQQVSSIRSRGEVVSYIGKTIKLKGQTFCLHGDGENALEIVKAIKGKPNQTLP